jgi:hypothetical protein
VFTILVYTFNVHAQSSLVNWSAFNMGFGVATSGTTQIKSVVGQSFVGEAQQGTTRLISGFLAYTPGIISGVEEINLIPSSYSLMQNYPNPFNPTTVIRYQLPVNSWVTLKIYNVLGQEVATLVNEDKQPGVYNEKLEGSSLSSGVYYFRLSATSSSDPSKSFTQVKKMLLLK